MSKTTVTFYLPKDVFEQAKIEAVKKVTSFSDLALRCVLALIEQDAFERSHSKPPTEEKTMIYLSEEEKKRIKRYTAAHAVTISELFCQALVYYMADVNALPAREKQADRRGRPKSENPPGEKKKTITYHLTKTNDTKLRNLSAETGKTRTELILEAVNSVHEPDIISYDRKESLDTRSSMNITHDELKLLKGKAHELNVSVFKLFNIAVSQKL